MGRGDKKSKKGKIWKGTFGVSRNKGKIKSHLKRVSAKKVSGTETSAVETPVKAKRVAKKKTEA